MSQQQQSSSSSLGINNHDKEYTQHSREPSSSIILNKSDKIMDVTNFTSNSPQIISHRPIITNNPPEKSKQQQQQHAVDHLDSKSTILHHAAASADEEEEEDEDDVLKQQESNLNHELDGRILKNTASMPWSIYFIIPNEFSERFCFYGIVPLLNSFFKRYLGEGPEKAVMLVSLFKFVSYFTPLFGSALSDSYLAKYNTIVTLSCVYTIGVILLSIFSTPAIMGFPIQSWPIMVSLILLAIGTGGIKPCVSSHGGDQFPSSMPTTMLNRFYNLFYMSINAGALIAGYVTPIIAEKSCYGSENCYTWAFGICAIVMIFALIIFAIGRPWYRIIPPLRKFIPFEMVKMVLKASYRNYKNGKWKAHGMSFFDSISNAYPSWFIRESKDLLIVLGLITPTLLFWTGFDQKDSTWQNTYEQMNPMWGSLHIDAAMNGNLNPIFIIILTPIFTFYIYPWIEKKFGTRRFRLLNRMICGMLLASIAFLIMAIIQLRIDAHPEVLIYDEAAEQYVCNPANYAACIHGAWTIIPFFIITSGEIMYSISGLNLVYEEVGKRMKSSAAALWLLMTALGNLLAAALAPALVIGTAKFYFMTAGIIFGALLIYSVMAMKYTYRIDRYHHPKNAILTSAS